MTNALFVAWRSGDAAHGRWGPVGRLEHEAAGYRFVYTRGAQTLKGFKSFPGMPDLATVYESDALFPLFANRLLARSRPEYQAYLGWSGFEPDDPPDPIAILGVTEGRRVTDSVELFPCPQPDADGCYINKFFLHGVRWIDAKGLDRISRLNAGDPLTLLPEPANNYDPDAVVVLAAGTSEGVKIGYVPRYLARDVSELFSTCVPDLVRVTVERINQSAPLQQRVLCRMNACWPETFQPCGRDEFQPIVSELPSTAR